VSTSLQRLVVDFRGGELVVRALYRRSLEDGPSPNTKARAREVSELVRAGLEDALGALEGDVAMGGTSGFTTREDIMVASVARQPKEESAA
jgi:hypothetical protein